MGPPLTRNAADAEAVKQARRRERDRETQFSNALRELMQSKAGRAVMWDLLDRCGVFRSIYEPSARIYYNAGRQDFGHELLALLLSAGEDLYTEMEREARLKLRRENADTAAAHQPRAERGADHHD